MSESGPWGFKISRAARKKPGRSQPKVFCCWLWSPKVSQWMPLKPTFGEYHCLAGLGLGMRKARKEFITGNKIKTSGCWLTEQRKKRNTSRK